MDIEINLEDNNLSIDKMKFKKMLFVYNALEEGWTIKKKQESFIFTKNHEGKEEVFLESYLVGFMQSNFDLNKLLS
jgi:hypothetical protein